MTKISMILAAFAVFHSALAATARVSSRDEDRVYKAWHHAMTEIHPAHAGCYTARYPDLKWREIKCLPPSKKHFDVGDGYDYSPQLSSGTIESAEGTFTNLTGVTSETGEEGSPQQIPNAYSLQINSDLSFKTKAPGIVMADNSNPCAAPEANCKGWEQFVLSSNGTTAKVLIEYWLKGFHATYGACPVGKVTPAGYSGPYVFPFGPWEVVGDDCVANTPGAGGSALPSIPATELGKVDFKAYTSPNFDEVSIGYGPAMFHVSAINVLDLNQAWTTAEFNVFGDNDLTTAIFNPGATMTVVNALKGPGGSTLSASCPVSGSTGEKNNLNLSCPCFSNGGQISFTESNATNPSCSCPTGSVWNPSTSSCKCESPSQVMDPKTLQCSCPVVGAVLKNNVCSCYPGQVIIDNTCTCPLYHAFDPTLQKCVPVVGKCPLNCKWGCFVPYVSASGQPHWACKPQPGGMGNIFPGVVN